MKRVSIESNKGGVQPALDPGWYTFSLWWIIHRQSAGACGERPPAPTPSTMRWTVAGASFLCNVAPWVTASNPQWWLGFCPLVRLPSVAIQVLTPGLPPTLPGEEHLVCPLSFQISSKVTCHCTPPGNSLLISFTAEEDGDRVVSFFLHPPVQFSCWVNSICPAYLMSSVFVANHVNTHCLCMTTLSLEATWRPHAQM